jgi:glutathione S-transferase
MDSRKIAERIDSEYPTPALALDSPYTDRLIQNLRAGMGPLRPIFVYLVLTRVLADGSVPFFTASREEEAGMPMEQYYREQGAGAWDRSVGGFSGITALLQEKAGPFLEGEGVCYADFILAGVLLFFRQLGDDVWAEVLKASGDKGQAFLAHLEAVGPWAGRDSH